MRVSRAHDSRHVLIGQRIRAARLRLGISQAEVGNRLGVSYQQINKYEQGKNVLSGVALLDLATLLKVAVGWLLGEKGSAETGPAVGATRLQSRMLAAFSNIESHSAQLIAVRFVETLARDPASAQPGQQPDAGGNTDRR